MKLNRVINGSSYVRVDAMYVATDQNYNQAKTINTGKKDYDGNDINYLKLTLDSKSKEENKVKFLDSLLIVPDFGPYPLFYYSINLTRNVPLDGSRREVFKLDLEGPLAVSDSKNGSLFEPWRTFGSNNTPELRFVYSQKAPSKVNPLAYAKSKTTWTKELEELNTFFSKENEKLKAALKAQWEAVRKYMQDELDNAKKSTYDAEIAKILNETSEFRVINRVYHTSSTDYRIFYAKVKTEKSGNTIASLKLQLPYTDNVYYDKPQFFSKEILKNKNGAFETVAQDEFNIKGGEMIPFGGMILIGKRSDGKFTVNSIITPVELTPMAANIIEYGTVHSSNINNNTSSIPFKFFGEIYKEAAMKENLSTFHDFSKDSLNMEFWLTNYISTLLKK